MPAVSPMYALLLYALKTGACLTLFYLFFKLLLSRETFHRLNRAVVLSMLFLSCLLPLCVVTVTRELPPVADEAFAFAVRDGETIETAFVRETARGFRCETAAGWFWLLGALFVLGRTLRSMIGVRRLIRAGRSERLADGTVLVRATHEVAPFSWGRYIVMTERDLRENGEAILCHERAHVRLHHSADLLFCDLVCCLQWFNPALWLLRADLRAIHEYEADEAVLASGADARSYQLLLIKKAVGERWYSVANSFNHSNLKNRITMMIQKRSPRWAAAKALLLLPLAGAALGAFAETVYVAPAPAAEPAVAAVDRTEAEVSGKDSENRATMQAASARKRRSSQTTQVVTVRNGDGSVTTTTTTTATDRRGRTSSQRSESTTSLPASGGDSASIRIVQGTNGRVTAVTETQVQPLVVRSPKEQAADAGEPLIVVNGRTISREQLEQIAPSSIRSISVLKDADTAAKYGEAARHGVIVISMQQPDAESAARAAASAPVRAARRSAQDASVSVSGSRVIVKTDRDDEAGSLTAVYTGRLSLNGTPDVALFFIDGRAATREEVMSIRSRKIRKMVLYKGDDAVSRYGEAARKGVLEIRTRR